MRRTTGRNREADRVRRTMRAAAVGRLLLGEFDDWTEFLAPDVADYAALPRRHLKALDADARKRLSGEVRKFCRENFEGMSEAKLVQLYEAIKSTCGLTVPRADFESQFAKLRPSVARNAPAHATVEVSLWGLGFWFPEDQLSKDLIVALSDAGDAIRALDPHYRRAHRELVARQPELTEALRRRYHAARTGLLTAFNLLECFLNSLAWEILHDQSNPTDRSNRQRRLLEDATGVTMRDKLLKYPRLASGTELSSETVDLAEAFLNVVKPFRDSLVHPSPFDAPDRFGGYSKLRMVYRVDVDTLFLATSMLIDLITRIRAHAMPTGGSEPLPWLEDVREALNRHQAPTPPEWRFFPRYQAPPPS